MTHTKASQLIVLGNGFDLHCGLKSSYKDFLYYVITQRYTNYFQVIAKKHLIEMRQLKRHLLTLQTTWGYGELF